MFKEYIYVDNDDEEHQPPRPVTPPLLPPPPPGYHGIPTARDITMNSFALILEHIANILSEIAEWLRRM